MTTDPTGERRLVALRRDRRRLSQRRGPGGGVPDRARQGARVRQAAPRPDAVPVRPRRRWDDRRIAERIHLTVRPKGEERLSPDQVAELARIAHSETVDQDADGAVRFTFDADRYTPPTARGNLEMAARMQLGVRWHTRYEIEEG